uniref:Uncharacterized protein n=1 Tax=Rhizophora mucronata TaxID=61149 RepID=A0A2P2QB02_RHIMU
MDHNKTLLCTAWSIKCFRSSIRQR